MNNMKSIQDFDAYIYAGAEEQKLVIEVNTKSPLKDDEYKTLTDRLSRFVRAADNGMLCGKSFLPAVSSMKISNVQNVQNTNIKWNCLVRAIDPGAIRILWGLFTYYSHYIAPIQTLSVRALGSDVKPVISPVNIIRGEIEYPQPYRQPGFIVTREKPPRLDKYRRFQIEFDQKPMDNQIDYALDIVSDWDVLCMGGFPANGKEPYESGIAPGDIYMVDDFTLEHVINYFEGSEEAFNAIINLAGRFHNTICLVRQVKVW